jgi:hypothetical protein
MEGIISEGIGFHNKELENSIARLQRGGTYRDQSTIIIIPSTGVIVDRVVQNWWNLMTPMNQKAFKFIVSKMEVGIAYTQGIEMILNNPDLRNWKYILTLETDNLPPPDGLLKLLENMDTVDVVGGLYWTKGPAGQPMIYGNPKDMPLNFYPQVPIANSLQLCNGLGMGFTLFKLDIFKDTRIKKPWFETVQQYGPQGTRVYTQDLQFFEKLHGLGYRVGCDTRVLTGHLDISTDIVW